MTFRDFLSLNVPRLSNVSQRDVYAYSWLSLKAVLTLSGLGARNGGTEIMGVDREGVSTFPLWQWPLPRIFFSIFRVPECVFCALSSPSGEHVIDENF